MRLQGEPDFGRRPAVYSYLVGMWTGFRIDHDSFDVHIDHAGRVTRTRVVQH
ncbi:MAG TPA: hypothetical protein VHG51_10675 [Longimicrobiaceae bacterium]|nr:hypothetical protein [Longimicrobiaceae bacterium]